MYRKSLAGYFENYVLQTAHYTAMKATFEDKLKQIMYEGKSFDPAEKKTWLNYIEYEKKVPANQHPHILYTIEKAVTYMCTCPEIWRELVDYLENRVGDREYLLGSLHNYRKMLRNIE